MDSQPLHPCCPKQKWCMECSNQEAKTLQLDPHEVRAHILWMDQEQNMKSLQPIAIPSDIPLAPSDILQVIRCTCSSETHCKSSQCGCNRAKLVCTMFCTCQNLTACYNEQISTSWIGQHRCKLSALVVEALCQKLGKLYHNYPNDVWASSAFLKHIESIWNWIGNVHHP